MSEKRLNKYSPQTYNPVMLAFELCPICKNRDHDIDQLKPMILSGDDRMMQCDTCNREFSVWQAESLLCLARQRREKRYGNVEVE